MEVTLLFTYAYDGINYEDMRRLHEWGRTLRLIDHTGTVLSLFSLMIALYIFTKFKRLLVTRVKIHINLFIALSMQSVLGMVRNVCFGREIISTLLHPPTADEYAISVICRFLIMMRHYFELTTFMWLLIEGWFFYSHISLAPYRDHDSILPHILVGWGFPLTIMIPWVIIHIHSKHTNFCWVDTDIKINIIVVPVLIIILVNLGFFILNVRIIFIKAKNSHSLQGNMQYWRLIKSSLMLVPLFGTYDVLYIFWPFLNSFYGRVIFIVPAQIICAFQGFMIATVYCFTNGHVKSEIFRAWCNWKLKREIHSEIMDRQTRQIKYLDQIKRIDPVFDNYI